MAAFWPIGTLFKCEALTIVSGKFPFFPLFSSFASVNQTGSNKERKIKKEILLQGWEMVRKKNRSSSLKKFLIYPLVFPRGQTYAFAAEKAVNHNLLETNPDFFFICFAPCKAIKHSLRFYRDSGYSGFRIPRAAFHKPNFPDSGIRISLHVIIREKLVWMNLYHPREDFHSQSSWIAESQLFHDLVSIMTSPAHVIKSGEL